MEDNPGADKKPTKGYGKRSMKQWVLIYVVVAVIVYALIYFIFIRKSGSGGGGLGY
jgi:flagellar basal body-associated protein FliL